jgi:PHP-associated
MPAPKPFDAEGVWLKAALHTHTSATDGELTPEAHVLHHEWAGFDVVAITDHWTLTAAPSTDRLLVIQGAELAVDPLGPGRYTEVLAIGIDDIPEDPGGDRVHWNHDENYHFRTFPDLSTAASAIAGQGGASYVAHPYWSGLPPQVVLDAQGLTGLELFNAGAERENGRGDASYAWDLALEAGKPMFAIAADDCHYPGFDIGDAWTMIRAPERSRDAVMAALHAGHTYASSGPAVHDARRDGDALEVRCSPCMSVIFQSRWELGWGVRADHRNREEGARVLERDDRGLVVRARFEPPPGTPDLPYVRVVVRDAAGRAAWTNPV